VGGDSVYGDSPTFVQGVRQFAKSYVLDSSADARVWTSAPRVIAAEERPRPKRGRPCTQPRVVGEAKRVDEVGVWQRFATNWAIAALTHLPQLDHQR
jgi:hypothetical protein